MCGRGSANGENLLIKCRYFGQLSDRSTISHGIVLSSPLPNVAIVVIAELCGS